jgi:hypothetical protein
MNIDYNSGFDCPTIGSQVPNGYEIVKTQNNIWEIRKIFSGEKVYGKGTRSNKSQRRSDRGKE